MINRNLFKLYEEFKTSNHLNYQEAFEVFIDLLQGSITGNSQAKNMKYEKSVLPLVEAYVELVCKEPFWDHLGLLYQEVLYKYGKPYLGQFFTPPDVSKLLATLAQSKRQKHSSWIRLNDPCAGSGALPLAFCEENQAMTVELILNDKSPLCCEILKIQLWFCFLVRGELKNLKLIITSGDILISPFGDKIHFSFGYDCNLAVLYTLLGRHRL